MQKTQTPKRSRSKSALRSNPKTIPKDLSVREKLRTKLSAANSLGNGSKGGTTVIKVNSGPKKIVKATKKYKKRSQSRRQYHGPYNHEHYMTNSRGYPHATWIKGSYKKKQALKKEKAEKKQAEQAAKQEGQSEKTNKLYALRNNLPNPLFNENTIQHEVGENARSQPMHISQEDDALLLFETTRLNPGERESPYVDEGHSLPLSPLIGTWNSQVSVNFSSTTTTNYQLFLLTPTLGYARNNSGYAQFIRNNPTDTVDILPAIGAFAAFQSNIAAFGSNPGVFSDLFFAYSQRIDVTMGFPDATGAGYVYMGSRPLSAFKNSSTILVGDLVGTATTVLPAEHNKVYSIRGAVKNTKAIHSVYAAPDSSSQPIGWNEIAEERVWYMIIYRPALSLTTNAPIDVTMNVQMSYNAVYNPDGKLTPLVEQAQHTAVVTTNPTPAETMLSSNIATMLTDPEPQDNDFIDELIDSVKDGAMGVVESLISDSIANLSTEPLALAIGGFLLTSHNAVNYNRVNVEIVWWTMNWILPKLRIDSSTLPAELLDTHLHTLENIANQVAVYREFLDDNPVQADGSLPTINRQDQMLQPPLVNTKKLNNSFRNGG